MEIKWLREAENEPTGQQCALEGRACSRKENSEKELQSDICSGNNRKARPCVLAFIAAEGKGGTGGL